MKKAVFLSLLLSFSYFANAADVWHTSPIKSVYPLSDGGFVITFINDEQSCTNANRPRYFYVKTGVNGMSAEGANKIYALVLTAASQKLPLTIAYDNTTDACAVNRALVQFAG